MKASSAISHSMKKVWKPAWGSPVFFVFPFFMVVFSTIFVAGRVRNWIGEIGHNSHVFGAEFVAESGPDYLAARDQHAELLRIYISSSESGFSSSLVNIVFPQFSLRGRFSEALENLEMAHTQREASLAIGIAGEKCVEFSESAIEFAGGPILSRGREIPPSLWEHLQEALDESEISLKELLSDPNLLRAEKVCMANRRALLLAVLADNYKAIPVHVNRLYGYVKQSADRMTELLASTPGGSAARNYLELYIRSETFRLGILDAMRNEDIYGAHALLRTAIKVAFKERESMLESGHDFKGGAPP